MLYQEDATTSYLRLVEVFLSEDAFEIEEKSTYVQILKFNCYHMRL